jgi:hypothetical protein
VTSELSVLAAITESRAELLFCVVSSKILYTHKFRIFRGKALIKICKRELSFKVYMKYIIEIFGKIADEEQRKEMLS